MIVMKFGGTSVGRPDRMREVAGLIAGGGRKIVVLSAVSGTTNKLLALAEHLHGRQEAEARVLLGVLQEEYRTFIAELFPEETFRVAGMQALEDFCTSISMQFVPAFGIREEKTIVAQGELLSTRLFHIYLSSCGIAAEWLPALGFMRIGADGTPDMDWIRDRLGWLLRQNPAQTCYITQGYICRNAVGEVDNLQRGGSDYTATIVGAAVQADEIEIWTDIDGLHNADPRLVEGTRPLRAVSYREAAELAYFGAKILHPTCVIPAEEAGIPIRLKNTFHPEASGTLISENPSGQAVAALAVKDGITAVRIRSARMLNAYGFLRQVFEVFEQYRTPIDMITTSEVSVSVTIDREEELPAIQRALEEYAEVQIERGHSILSIVGDGLYEKEGIASRIFSALEGFPLRMAAYGGSTNNISLLLPTRCKAEAMQRLHQALFCGEVAVESVLRG